ncbi:MAG: hypothetical protein IMZ64_05720 [Bacteroidetes bacterium]|nr:hypothetical protein [Bacteroidota bacterium]
MFLWFIPITSAIYDFRTDIQTDNFQVISALAVNTGNVTLSRELYDNDIQTINLNSNLSTDDPVLTSYNGTTRVLQLSGFTADSTRTLEVVYDKASFTPSSSINSFMDVLPWFWMILLAVFPFAALAYIWWGRLTASDSNE